LPPVTWQVAEELHLTYTLFVEKYIREIAT